MKYSSIIILIVALGALGVWYFQGASFSIPSGETTVFVDQEKSEEQNVVKKVETETPDSDNTQIQLAQREKTQDEKGVSLDIDNTKTEAIQPRQSRREILMTDGIKH